MVIVNIIIVIVNEHHVYCEYPPDLKVRLQLEQPAHGHLSEVCPGVWTRVSGPLNICYSYLTVRCIYVLYMSYSTVYSNTVHRCLDQGVRSLEYMLQ